MKTIVVALLGILIFSGTAFAQPTPNPAVTLKEEGVTLGPVLFLDCVGGGIICTKSSLTGSLAVTGAYAPIDATYITQIPNGTLTAEQALSLLGTGLLFSTTGTGVVSIYPGVTCTNQVLTALSAAGAGTCTTITSAYVDSSIVPSTRTISTVAPLSGGGDLSANRTITTSMATARLLGRTTAGSGVAEEIAVSSPLTLSALALACPTCVTQAYSLIQDEGVSQTQRTTLDFVGAGVTCSDVGGETSCNIPGGGGSAYNLIENEGVPLTARTTIDFVGAGVTCSDVAGETQCSISGGGSANVVEVSLNLGTAMGLYYSTVVTGQAWVTAASTIVCSLLGVTTDGQTVETVAVSGVQPSISDRVVGTGFNLNVYSPNGATGIYRFGCIGA